MRALDPEVLRRRSLPHGPDRASQRPRVAGSTAPQHQLIALQRSAGNAAVAQLLAGAKHDDPDEQASAATAEPTAAAEPTAGTVEDLVGEPLGTSCEDSISGPSVPLQLHAEIGFDSATGERDPDAADVKADARARAKDDAVGSTVNFGSTVTEGGATPGASEFGLELATYKADNIKWTRDAAKSLVNVEARLFLDIGWGVHDLGRTDVAGPTSAAVSKAKWSTIRDDLKPDGTGRPTRSQYWAKDLTSKHEQFHASDDIARARLYIPTAKAYLDGQTVDGSTAAKLEADVRRHVETVRANIQADGWAYYDRAGGAGENRAYADGKSSYQQRVDAISARAVTEKW